MAKSAVIWAVLALAAGASGPAAAQDRPPLVPSRDVDVTYRMGEDGAMRQRTRWQAAGQRMRVDTPTPGVYMIVDYATRRMSLVSDPDRGVLEIEAKQGSLPGQAPGGGGAGFTREGSAEIAGAACTEWRTVDSRGVPTVACITQDGVLLRVEQGGRVLAEATKVAYGSFDPAVFIVPPGYARIDRTGASR